MPNRLAPMLLGGAPLLAACSGYHEVSNLGDLEAGQRAVIGRVVPLNGEISDWVSGTYLGSDLVFSDHLPLDDQGRLDLSAHSGDTLSNGSSSFGSKGGVFSVGIDARKHFLLGIRAETTHWLWSTTTLLPMILRIPPRVADCEYAGTFYVGLGESQVEYALRDELDRHRSTLEAKVAGCKLVKNLAATYP
jgi:hypothetical protein